MIIRQTYCNMMYGEHKRLINTEPSLYYKVTTHSMPCMTQMMNILSEMQADTAATSAATPI